MRQITLKHIWINWIVVAALFVILVGIIMVLFLRMDAMALTKRANRLLLEQENIATEVLNEMRTSENFHVQKKSQKSNFYLVYENDSIIFWTSDHDPIPFSLSELGDLQHRLIKLKNGWFLHHVQQDGSRTYLALIPVYYSYGITNDYFKTSFSEKLQLSDDCEISFSNHNFPIYDQSGTILFGINFPKTIYFTGWRYYVVFIVFLAFYLAILFCLYQTYFYYARRTRKKTPLFCYFLLLMCVFPAFILSVKIPSVIFNHPLFSPKYFAFNNHLFSSLGMVFLTAVTAISISYFIFSFVVSWRNSKTIKIPGWLNFLYPILSGLLFVLFCFLIKTLTMNTIVFFDLSYIFNIDIYTVILIFSLCCFACSVFLKNLILTTMLSLSPKQLIILIAESILVVFFIWMQQDCRWMMFILSSLWIIVPALFVFQAKTIQKKNLFYFIIFLALLSVALLDYFIDRSENNKQAVLAGEFAMRGREEEKEYFFTQLSEQILKDPVIQDFLENFEDSCFLTEQDQISNFIVEKYLKLYWKGYHSITNVCTTSDKLKISTLTEETSCIDYFTGIIDEFGATTGSENLFFISYDYASYAYLGVIRPNNSDSTKIMPIFFLEMRPLQPLHDLGYPEFLVEQNVLTAIDANRYSYAVYGKDGLEYSFGSAVYPLALFSQIPQDSTVRSCFYQWGEWSNYQYRMSPDKTLVISRKKKNLAQTFSTFIYLLLVFFIVLFLVFLFSDLQIGVFSDSNLRAKLQKSIFLILLLVFTLIGGTFIYFMNTLNLQKDRDSLQQKTASILHILDNQPNMIQKSPVEETEAVLANLSNIFFSEINIYLPSGKLYATSSPIIFEQGLLPKLMNYNVLRQIVHKEEHTIIQEEHIGSKQHLSSYTCIHDHDGNLTAILNIPYFPRIGQYENDMAAFISTFLNIYSFVFLLFMGILLYISGEITRPVRILTQYFGKMRIGKKNERILWSGGDEFAKLIEEYNCMVDALDDSARKLANSERESGWREMAQQVAHEIKNPLTPMKLSVQHLQRTWKDTIGNKEEQINRFCNTLIQQIDALSDISNEFSNFAKMPQPHKKTIRLHDVISASIAMYDNSNVKFHTSVPESCILFADSNLLLRAFNNLIRNAIQSFEEAESGTIWIDAKEFGEHIIVTIEDNGCGIPSDLISRIFIPTFTTRLTGMGLGLPMVKTIIEEHNGEISVSSKEKQGTCFTIIFRKTNERN